MMTIKRAQQILSCYGANPERWPVDERTALQQLLLINNDLQILRQREQSLDKQFAPLFSDTEAIETQQLQQRILDSLPDKAPANILNSCLDGLKQNVYCASLGHKGLLPRFPETAWRTSAMLLILLAVISFIQLNNKTNKEALWLANNDDELSLMADTLLDPSDQELVVLLEPELIDDARN